MGRLTNVPPAKTTSSPSTASASSVTPKPVVSSSTPTTTPNTTPNTTAIASSADDWKGPLERTYLPVYCPVRGRHSFPSLQEAQQAACESEDCGGITKEVNGAYTLRKSSDPHPSPSGEISWVKLKLFSGAFNDTSLYGYCPSAGHHIFNRLEDAKAAASILPDCSGITLEPPTSYTLRCGTTAGPSSNGETSWLKIGNGQFAGPFPNSYLPGYCPGQGKHVFSTLAEAKQAAMVMPCGGLTMESPTVFSIRCGTSPISTPGSVSWLKKLNHATAMRWEGPHSYSYLNGYCQSGGDYTFSTLEKAQEAAEKLVDCGGVTMEGPGRYTLRVGTNLGPSPSGETSWVLNRG
ncbi:hypothetical protein Pelo_10435 [Pelomyxa schiedti]|nr:hypothetical protein Pelo_10435 [Pelomyxa schiedti]